MIDFWDNNIKKNITKDIPVMVINDLDKEWKGRITLKLLNSASVVQESTKEIILNPFGQITISFVIDTNLKEGEYTIEASLIDTPFGTVKSIRNFKI
jgi:hypothetical protein